LSRYFDVETDIALARQKEFAGFELMPKMILHFNQGIMEFGALQCAQSPNCGVCFLTIVVLHYKKRK
jgi:adenine-specific DNA glycosylase